MKESELIDPKATKTTLSQTEKKKSQPTDRHHKDNITLNQGKECPPQETPVEIARPARASGDGSTIHGFMQFKKVYRRHDYSILAFAPFLNFHVEIVKLIPQIPQTAVN
jgi:hypothetical protein